MTGGERERAVFGIACFIYLAMERGKGGEREREREGERDSSL